MAFRSSWSRLRGLVPGLDRRSLPFRLISRYVVKDASGAIVEARPDPPLIVAAGALTLALAIFANIAILFRLIDTHPVSAAHQNSLVSVGGRRPRSSACGPPKKP